MNKSTEQLRREYDEAQAKLRQVQNRLARLENRIQISSKGRIPISSATSAAK